MSEMAADADAGLVCRHLIGVDGKMNVYREVLDQSVDPLGLDRGALEFSRIVCVRYDADPFKGKPA